MEDSMNTKVWTRLVMAGLLTTSLFVVAGCGDTAEEKQAKIEKMIQDSAKQAQEQDIALANTLSKPAPWTEAINKLKEKSELKSAPVQVSGNFVFADKQFTVDVVKPGTKELLRYTYDLDKGVWSDGREVEIVGPGKNTIDRTFYPIDSLNVNAMIAMTEKFTQEVQSNSELKASYRGYFSYASMGFNPDNNSFVYEVRQTANGRDDAMASEMIDMVFNQDGDITKISVKPKGSTDYKEVM